MNTKLRELGVYLAKNENYDDSIFFLKQAIKNGDLDAVNDLGVVLEENKNYEEAIKCYLYASKKGSKCAYRNLGNMYEQGLGVPVDIDKAIKCYKKSAKLGYPNAYLKLSEIYYFAKGVKKDDKKSFMCLVKGSSLEKNNPDEIGCTISLGYYYECGIGTNVDMEKSYKCYKKAAKTLNPAGLYDYALCYLFGKGIKKNIRLAINLLEESAKRGYGDAANRLSSIYRNEKYIYKDEDIANFWLYEGLKMNSTRCLLQYAELNLSGQNAEKEINIGEASKAICKFLEDIDPSYEDEINEYKELKQKYIDLIPWDVIEINPREYIQNEKGVKKYQA